MQSVLDALQPWASANSSVHIVEDWLASNAAIWSSTLRTNSATSWAEDATTNEEHTFAGGHKRIVEIAAPKQPTVAEQCTAVNVSVQQPTVLHQQRVVEHHAMPRPADQQFIAQAASQHASAEAFRQQSGVHGLVQQFEHMTVAKPKARKQELLSAGLLASSADQASHRGLSANKMHLMFERAAAITPLRDAQHSDAAESARSSRQVQLRFHGADVAQIRAAESARPSKQIQPSLDGANAKHSDTATGRARPSRQPSFSGAVPHGPELIDWSSSSQPAEWHLNTAFESDSWPAERGAANESRPRSANQTRCDAAVAPCDASPLWIEELANLANAERASVQEYNWPASR